MQKRAYSIGYERRELAEFIQVLKAGGISRVADVRNAPFSRKEGFSKKELSAALEAEGISYRGFVPLGAPPALREGVPNMKWDQFVAGYRRHFETVGSAYLELKGYLGDDGGALMCVERDPKECHRSVIEEALRRDGYQVIVVGETGDRAWF